MVETKKKIKPGQVLAHEEELAIVVNYEVRVRGRGCGGRG